MAIPQVRSKRRANAGFSLVVTVSMMILLTVIAVGLLTLSSVSIKSAGISAAEARARANARMALMMALDRLQNEMGPDQRVSANSDILSATTSVANPHWMGVWDSWIAGAAGTATVNSNYPSALNSTHQTIGAQADPLMRPTYSQKNRHFRGWLLSMNPDDVTNIYAPNSPSFVGVRFPAESDNGVILVGSGSVGASSTAADQVSAMLIEIDTSDRGDRNRGRFAWWVGDESQKATIMQDAYANAASLSMAQRLFRQEAPGSMGNTSVTGLDQLTDESQLPGLVSKKSIELLTGVGPDRARPRYHDITTLSMGVLADVREGGLKRDLSTILERNINPDEMFNFTYVEEFQRPTSYKPGADAFKLYEFESLLQSVSTTGMACVPIQDLAAYYQLYDHERSGWAGGVQTSSSQSSPPNSLLSNGFMVSTPDLGYSNSDYEKYLRQYTYQYRRPAPVKQELVLHFVTEQRDFAAEIAAWLALPANAGKTQADAELALRIPQDPYNLRIGLTPAMTFWNPYNVPLVMNDWKSFPASPGSNSYPKQDKSSYTWMEDAIPLNLTFKKGTSATDPAPVTAVRQMSSIYDSGYQPYFYTNGNYPLVFEPGESKVLSLQATSLTDPSVGLSEVNFQNRGGGGGADNEHFVPELELIPGWLPDRFVRSSEAGNRNWNGKKVVPVFTFKDGDYISVDIVAGGGDFGFTAVSTCRQARNPYPMYHHQLFNWLPRMNANATFISNFVYMGFPRSGRGGIASTAVRPINIPPRQASQLIAAMGDPANKTDDIPQAFFYYSRKAATETHESKNSSPPLGGAGRRFPARPFLHSPLAQSALIDNIDGASLYNFGWSWFFMPLNNMLDAPISISARNSGYFGGGYTAESGTTHLVQQQLPLTPPMSIAALSHAQLGGYSVATEAPAYLFGNWPWPDRRSTQVEGYRRTTATGYGGLSPRVSQAIGNSYAHPNIPAGKAYTTFDRVYVEGVNTRTPYVDHSYLANKALWDEFFFSSITPVPDNPVYGSSPKSVDQVASDFFFNHEALPNRRMLAYSQNLDQAGLDSLLSKYSDFSGGFADKIAAHLMVNGSFNINSTSVEAWKALFSSMKGKPVAYLDKDTALSGGVTLKEDVPTGTPIAAGGVPNAESFSGSQSDPSDPEQWIGWRELTDDEIDELAKAMVRQVKKRGPFLSLSEFVNRRLDSADPELSVMGALQAAIDDPTIPTAKAINGGFRNSTRQFTSAEKSYVNAAFPQAMDGAIAYGSAAYIDQADILRNLAEQLTPRGDTFVVRAYGDSLDAKGNVEARAWCEATIQRLPEYVDSNSSTGDDPETKQADLRSPANKMFGRKMEVIGFRWLNSSEI